MLVIYVAIVLSVIIGLTILLTVIGQKNHIKSLEHLSFKRKNLDLQDFLSTLRKDVQSHDSIKTIYDYLNDSIYDVQGVLPHTQDRLSEDLNMQPEELEELVEGFFYIKDISLPTRVNPEYIPNLATIEDIVYYFEKLTKDYPTQK